MYGNPYAQQTAMQGKMANMQMGGTGVGSMGMLGMGGMGRGTFFYVGNSVGLETKLDKMKNNSTQYSDTNLIVNGNQVKDMHIWIMVLTMIASALCILPNFCM